MGLPKASKRYREAVQKTMMEMQASVCEADARIQVLHAAIGQDLEASEEDTISVWEAIAALKRGLEQVTGTSELNADFLTEARKNLPIIVENLAKLSGHYMVNMLHINKALEGTRNRLTALESGPVRTTDMFDFAIDVDDPKEDTNAAIHKVRSTLETSIGELRADVDALVAQTGARGSGGSGRPDLDDLVSEILGRLGDLEARTSGEGFASGDHVFNSETSMSEWLLAESVPNAGCFGDLFSVLACMSPERQRGKEKAGETYSATESIQHSWITIFWLP
jgi:hypothetical protein